ncbi:MAG: radical SAM protein [Candidatus Cloacimonetes bacterium]|jgi:7-carboxy-7-deazaguanine synthase|nr:radical SAM protein [Candidatus Cloacimonadota bacterium]MBT6994217.1 radical SAM protein [Candidatus Cloacimonadota bacterium]MBT7469868.1 radical SAM protein [Candidatus Cloacimonadota bacterium]
MLNISEIFYSLQGESSFAGKLCVFIRFAGCNLRCKYCDTKYSYKSDLLLTIPKIIEKIEQYQPTKLVEITGGEPLLQDEVYPLFEKLTNQNYEILLETNGSVNLEKVPNYVTKIVDIKCPESGESNSFLIKNLDFINLKKDELKFVISNVSDYHFAKEFIQKNNLIKHKIIFSPVSNKIDFKKLAELIIKDKLPVRLQIQLHKIIWGDEKGV